jgi:hypothetical protein
VFPDNQNRPAHAMIVASSSKLGSKPTALASHHLEFTYVVPGQSPHQSFLTTSDEGVAVADLLPPPTCADGLTLSVLDTDARLRVELILRPPGSLQLRGAGCN